MLLIYGLAVLALNILTGGSGQFSLGQSAFYAVGAYTSAILMEHAGMNYALTLPIAGIICFGFGFLFGQPALRLSGVYLALATFALATAMPQLLKLGYFENWTGGVQGPGRDQARCAVRPADVTGQVAVLFHARGHDRDLHLLRQPVEVALRARLHGDPRQ
jgi:ABC-type branched-subunit amino acid transport system permease subunit